MHSKENPANTEMTNYLIKCAMGKTIVVKVGLGVFCIAAFNHISVGVFYWDP